MADTAEDNSSRETADSLGAYADDFLKADDNSSRDAADSLCAYADVSVDGSLGLFSSDSIKQEDGCLQSNLKSGSKVPKVCGVCADTAFGCNFDAITCESCKAFFRRNAMKEDKLRCLFTGDCIIDVNTRKFCPRCRIVKCFKIGMKKEYILDDSAKQQRLQKVINNKLHKQHKRCPSDPELAPPPTKVIKTKSSDESVSIIPNSQQNDNIDINITSLSESLANYTSMQQLVASPPIEMLLGMTPQNYVTLQQPEVPTPAFNGYTPTKIEIRFDPQASNTCNLLSKMSTLKMPDPSTLETCNNGNPLEQVVMRNLSPDESAMIDKLLEMYDCSFTTDLEPLIHLKQLDPSINQLVNQSSITVLRIIKFAKRLDEFAQLPQECQIGLLKGAWINILLLRSISLYDSERDMWVTQRAQIPTNILKNATGFSELHNDHVQYCKSIKQVIKDDICIIILLLIIVLFSPESNNISNKELISNIQDKFMLLLKHYLESKYSYVKAADMYRTLIYKIKELRALSDNHSKHLLDLNPQEIEPIMLEILDLK